MRKRILAGILSLVMILALLPVSALAADNGATITGSAEVSLQKPGNDVTTGLTMPYIDITNCDQYKDANGNISFKYYIKIKSSSFFDTHVKPFADIESAYKGRWKSSKDAKSFTATIPADIFSKYLTVDWSGAEEIYNTGPKAYEILKCNATDGIVLQGKEGSNNVCSSDTYSGVTVRVPVTLPADKLAKVAEEGALNLNGTAVISNSQLGTDKDLRYTISHSITVEDPNNRIGNLGVTGPDGAQPKFNGPDGVWMLDGSGPYTVSGTAKDIEGLKVSGNATITLDNATIKHTSDREESYAPAISIEAGSDAKLILSGTNTIEGGPGCAGIYVAPGAKLTISGNGSLEVRGGNGYKNGNDGYPKVPATVYAAGGAGIGGNGIRFNPQTDIVLDGSTASFGEIIVNNGNITAVGGDLGVANTGGGSGIGTGGNSTKDGNERAETVGKSIIINGGEISATGGRGDWEGREGAGNNPSLTGGGAGIGSGGCTGGFYTQNSIVDITINGGMVTARGMDDGAGIGGGANVEGGVISITGGEINATGGYEIEDGKQCDFYGGAGIGGGDNGGVTSISITGGTVTAKAIGAAAGIGSGNDGFVGYINYNYKTTKTIPGSISIGGTADVTAYGGSHVSGTKFGGAGIGAGQSYYYDNGCGAITISGNAKVKAYAGPTAQAIGVGANYEANEGKDVNSLTIADTVTLWAQNQDKALPALLNETVRGKSTLTYNSTDKYLVSNTADENKAVGYFQLPNGEATEFDYTLENGKLTIGGVEITAAAPVDHVGNWATIYGKPQYTVTYYVDGEATKTEVVQGGEKAPEFTPEPSKSGQVFIGWYTDAEKKNFYSFETPVTDNLDLYARFIEIDIEIDIDILVDIITEGREAVTISDDQKGALAQNIDFEQDVGVNTTKIEIDAIVKEAEDETEISKITEYLTENQYNCGSNRIGYDIAVKKLIYTNGTLATTQELHKLKSPIQITFAIPDKWQSGGTVYMFRAHDNEGNIIVEVLEDKDADNATYTIESDKFSTYTMIYVPSPGGGAIYYTLHYDSNGGTQYKDERHRRNTVVQLDKVPVREGYQFTGWYGDKDLTEQVTSVKMTGDKTVYAGWHKSTVPDMLNGEDHFAYVIGYGDGTVHPGADISRAEVATIFFRLLKPEIRDGNLTDASPFADVSQGMWCNKAIATMAKLGIVKGRTAETFDPSAPITRAEFAAICARFDTGMTQGSSNFTDLAGHWAKEEIERAVSLGWIMGYADGTFRPDNPITRAEAMTMINRVLCRIPEDGDDLLPGMKTWPDNQPGDWYYLAVQEATNSHEFQHKGEIHEHWTKLTADPDWTRYQD